MWPTQGEALFGIMMGGTRPKAALRNFDEARAKPEAPVKLTAPANSPISIDRGCKKEPCLQRIE